MPRGAPRTYDVDVKALDLDELEKRLRAAGQSARTTRSILSYVILSQAGRKVEIPRASESRYRRQICEALGIPPGPPPRNARRREIVEAGRANVRALTAVAGPSSAAAAAATGRPLLALAALALPPISHDPVNPESDALVGLPRAA